MDCLPLPVVCIQCGPGVNNACHFKFIGERLQARGYQHTLRRMRF